MAYDPAKSPHYKVVCVRDSDSSEGRKEDYLSCQLRYTHLRLALGESLVILSLHMFICYTKVEYFGMVLFIGLIVMILPCISMLTRSNEEKCQYLQLPFQLPFLMIVNLGKGSGISDSLEITCILLRYILLV